METIMAELPVRAHFAPANPLLAFDPTPAQLVELLATLGRECIEQVVEGTIALLDLIDGDTDREGGWSEDDISDDMSLHMRRAFGPGCEMSDAGEYSQPEGGS